MPAARPIPAREESVSEPGWWCNERCVCIARRRADLLVRIAIAGLVSVATACSRERATANEQAPATSASSRLALPSASAEPPKPASGSAEIPSAEPPAVPDAPAPSAEVYPWLGAASAPTVDGSLATRIAPPPGYTRIAVEPGGFPAFVRGLPLSPAGTAVTAHDGDVVRAADDDYVEAVVALDVGSSDVQQSVDVIVRLHAEWLWSRNEKSKISYVALTKLALPLSRWEKGQRLITNNGADVFWAIQAKPKEVDYTEFRRYLDGVFLWQNAMSLGLRSRNLDQPEQLLPGDFFLHARSPGHVAIVLDVAEKPGGERVALLGQALNPAQSLHVLRPGRATPWFSLRPGTAIVTPYTAEFGWNELRRLDAEPASEETADGGT